MKPEKPLLQLSDVELLEQQCCYDGFLKLKKFTLRHRLFEGGWSGNLSRELLQRHEAVGVLPYDPQLDAILLIEQFRVGALSHQLQQQPSDQRASPWMLEIIAGLIDKDESVETVARREAEEEAAIVINALEPIHRYYSSPGGTDEYCSLYCGQADLRQAGGVHGLAEEGEDIRIHVLAAARCQQLLDEGVVRNAHALIALQWFVMNRDRLRQRWLPGEGND
jgi:ADP-ribose pyrophosphatase